MSRILIVDDEDSILRILSTLFKMRGFETATASDGEVAMEILAREKFDLLLTDVRMRPMDGLALLKFAVVHDSTMPVIMLTAYASVESAIEALKEGAFDYVTKPFDVGELVGTVDRALAFRNGMTDMHAGSERKDVRFYLDDIVAESTAMQDVCQKVQKLAPTETLVSIVGEAGCSKGLLAKALHNHSKRREKPFHSVNCAVIPEPLLEVELLGCEKGAVQGILETKKGLFEQVRGGTLFMEEIGCLPLRLQDMLLSVIQDKRVTRIGSSDPVPVSTRIIVSSNTEIETLVNRGIFKNDLFFRLNIVSLRVKPLREREADIVPLFALFLGRALKDSKDSPDVTAEAQAVLKSYTWSGNAEELEHAAFFAVKNLKNGNVEKDSLPPKIACTPIRAGVMESEPMKARLLREFLRNEGAEKDMEKAEAETRNRAAEVGS